MKKLFYKPAGSNGDLYSLTHNCTCKCDAETKHILNLFINENGDELLHQIIEE
jgi:hypothetical protein